MNSSTPISAAAAHYTGMAAQARAGSRISPADLRVRAGQLLNDAGDGNDVLAFNMRAAADHLATAAHFLDKVARQARAKAGQP